jgi:CubicO group peptidase (beta-lactamase class C family)
MKKLILVLLVYPYFLIAQNLQTDSLDAFIAKQAKDYNIPGLAIGIIKDDQVLWQKAYMRVDL